MTRQEVIGRLDWNRLDGAAHIRGFNYQPSWGRDGYQVWLGFDPERYEYELRRGKELYPVMSTVRIWLSYHAWKLDPKRAAANVATAIDIIDSLDLLAMPVLFNRWMGRPEFDVVWFGEIESADFERDFGPFIDAIVKPQAGREAVLAWDLCNEAVQRAAGANHHGEGGWEFEHLFARQLAWLEFTRERVKAIDPDAKTCIGYMNHFDEIEKRERFEALGELLTPHLYEWPHWHGQPTAQPPLEKWYDAYIRDFVTSLRDRGVAKPILSNESVWGSLDDETRAYHLGVTMRVLAKHGIGIMPHALWCSPVADLHPREIGPVFAPGYMAFINADGSMRAGHGIFNE